MSFRRLSHNNSTILGMSNSSEYSGLAGKSEDQSKVKASYKALLFKQHLKTCVEKIYTLIRDSLKKEISLFLTVSIQAPRSGRSKSPTSILASTVKKQASSIHWQSIIKSLDRTLTILCLNYVPSMLIKQMFNQVYAFINIQLFNRLLLRRECCSLSNAEFIKAGLQELEQWSGKATEFAGNSMDELQHISQAVGFLVLHKKSRKSLEEITNELCPDLTIPQICRIGTMFWDDKYGSQGLSQDVINQMKMMMADDPMGAQNTSFLLDDDSSLPISLDEISRSVPDISIVDVEAPPLLRQNPEFDFLLQ